MLPLILFAGIFSAEIAGVFFLAYRVIQLPLGLAGNGVSEVFYSKVSLLKQKDDIKKVVINTFLGLLIAATTSFIILVFFAPKLFSIVFGDNWEIAGTYVQYLLPWLLIQFCVSSVSRVVLVLEKQRGLLVSQVIFLVTRIGVILIGSYFGLSAEELILYFSFVSAFLYIGHFLWICSILDIGFKELLMAINLSFSSICLRFKRVF